MDGMETNQPNDKPEPPKKLTDAEREKVLEAERVAGRAAAEKPAKATKKG